MEAADENTMMHVDATMSDDYRSRITGSTEFVCGTI
jgi:hypothetical protein